MHSAASLMRQKGKTNLHRRGKSPEAADLWSLQTDIFLPTTMSSKERTRLRSTSLTDVISMQKLSELTLSLM